MQNELLTLKDIAQKLGLPESTMRKYRDAYAAHIPTVGSGRERLYRPRAVDIFDTIRKCRAEQLLSWEDTEKIIAEKFPPEPEPAPGSLFDQPPQIPAEDIEQLRSAIASIAAETEKNSFTLDTIAAELLRLSTAVKTLQDATSDITVIRRTVFAQNSDFRNFERGRREEREEFSRRITDIDAAASHLRGAVNESVAQMNAGIAQMQEGFKRTLARMEQEFKSGASNPEEIRRLTAVLKERNEEIGRLKAINSKVITENENLKSRIPDPAAHGTLEPRLPSSNQPHYEPHVPPHEPTIPRTERFTSGKFVFKGKKK